MANEFLLVLYVAGFGILAGLPVLIIPRFFAPRRPNPLKAQTFEAGQVPSGEARVHLMMQYYAYVLMFVVFDVMGMFLFAWAASFFKLGLPGAFTIIVFLIIILIPMIYALYLAGRRELW